MKEILNLINYSMEETNKMKNDILLGVDSIIGENNSLKKQLDSLNIQEEFSKAFLENYSNKGLCQDLETKVKTIVKEFKKSGTTKHIKYLPWAVVERIFHMQGGKIEVIDWKYEVSFDVKDYNAETGTIDDVKKTALFIHLRAYWKGQVLDEFYPIFDNQSSKIIKYPDAQEFNSSRQRGSVRLIARLSGIGLWIFEQQEEDDDDKDNNGEIKVIVKKDLEEKGSPIEDIKNDKKDSEEKMSPIEDIKKPKKEKKEKETKVKEDAFSEVIGEDLKEKAIEETKKNIENDPSITNMFLGNIIKNEEKKDEPQVPKVVVKEDFAIGSEEHSDLILELKSKYVRTFKDEIIRFRNEKGKELLGELTYNELKELIGILEKL